MSGASHADSRDLAVPIPGLAAMNNALLLAAMLLLAAAPLPAQCADGSPPPCPSKAQPASVRLASPPMSIAVLPLANRSPDTADVYFAEGMTDEIANQLARLGRLQVRARGMVAAQWRRTPDALEAARQLNVAWLVHGHVRHVNSQLVVNVELVRTATGEETWAARFSRGDADVFAVQSEVAESVAVAVGGRLTPRERLLLTTRPTRSTEAYRLYLLGNSLQVRRTAQELQRAIDAYRGAIRIDSSFAPAWARLAVAAMLRQNYDDGARTQGMTTAEIRSTIARAKTLDSTLSDVWLADGLLARREGDLVRARAHLERAVRLDTLSEEAVGSLGFYYLWHPLDSARAEPLLRRAIALNPDRKVSWLHLHYLRFYGGNLAAASALLDTVQALGPWAPTLTRRAAVAACLGDGAGALAAAAEAERMGRGPSREGIARFRVLIGDSSDARGRLTLARAVADTAGNPFTRNGANLDVGDLANALGQHDDAITAFLRVESDRDLFRMLHSPCYAPLRRDPRFPALMRKARSAIP